MNTNVLATKLFKENKKTKLDKEIERLLDDIKDYNPESDTYKTILERLERLSKLRKDEQQIKIRDVDIAQIFGSVVTFSSIWSILNYEQANVLTSKAFGIFMKGVGR